MEAKHIEDKGCLDIHGIKKDWLSKAKQRDVVVLNRKGKLEKATCTIEKGTSLLGFVINEVEESQGPDSCDVRTHGPLDGFENLIPGQRYILSNTTPGKIVPSFQADLFESGSFIYDVGFAISETVFHVRIGAAYGKS